jgi:hypothetical protein
MRADGGPFDPRPQSLLQRLYLMDWPGRDWESLGRCLLWISRAIDVYSKDAQPSAMGLTHAYDLVHPVRAIPEPGTLSM